MRICVWDIPGIPLGRRNLKDPRLDQVHKLVEAQKRVYAQADTVGPEQRASAESILTTEAGLPDLLLEDLEFIENRLGRDPAEAERAVLLKLQSELEAGRPVCRVNLTPAERAAIGAHRLLTATPITVARAQELEQPEDLLLRAFHQAGWITFFTVGGRENRAWPIRAGATAWEAAGAIHSDIQRGFIRAEVISLSDLLEAGGETQAKRAGKLRLEMKDYLVQDGDIMNFRFNR